MPDTTVTNNEAEQRFEITIDGHRAELTYRTDADRLVLGHAERQTVEHQQRAEGPRDPVERQ